MRSEEHTSELQSHVNLVCRLLLEKKKQTLYNSEAFISINARYKAVNITFYEGFDLSHTNIKGALQLVLYIEHHVHPYLPSFPTRRSSDLFEASTKFKDLPKPKGTLGWHYAVVAAKAK